MPNTTTSTELQRNYRSVVKKSRRAQSPIIILSHNKPEGVYIDYETFIRKFTGKSKKEKPRLKRGIERAFGSWTNDEAAEFDRVIEEMFEQVNPEGWK